MSRARSIRWPAFLAALLMVAAACGGDDGKSTDTNAGDGGGAEIQVTGSSTVEPISSLAAEAFKEESGQDVKVEGPGTGDGMIKFCAGEADIADASRTIKPEEATACKDKGIEFVELKIGFDGITVLTSPDNDLGCLSFADLYALTGPESKGFDRWTDASDLATELGSDTTFPDETLAVTGPGEESGTYDSFIEIAFKDIAEGRTADGKITEDDAKTTRPDYEASANDNTIILNVEGAKGSLGWVGFAFAQDAGDSVKEVEVSKEPGGDCVGPSAETIADASYPLSRGLYLYVNKAKAEANKAIGDFVDFYLDGLSEFVEQANYVNLPDDQVTETKSTWDARTPGTAAG